MAKEQDWKNRIVAEGEEAPDQLLANPHNWRIHPAEQRDALSAVLNEVGWVQRVIVNRKTGHLIDGHLRVALAISSGAKSVPVQYVELTENEEALILATLDPMTDMAATDKDQLAELIKGIETDNAAVSAVLAGISDRENLAPLDGDGPGGDDLPSGFAITYNLVFDDERQKDRFYDFLRWLQSEYEGETAAARLDSHIAATMGV